MMTIPGYLAVAQWALLFALGGLVLVLYRHLGRQFSLAKPAARPGPELGSAAAAFEYLRVPDGTVRRFTPGEGEPALLAFVEPTCPACEDLVTALGQASDGGDLAGLQVLLLISEPPSHLQISPTFRSTRLDIGEILADSTLSAYHASATPLLVAIDRAGVVRAAGPVMKRQDVRAFVQAVLVPPADRTALPVLPAGAGTGDASRETTTITEDQEVRLA
jgi:hypothetical protein